MTTDRDTGIWLATWMAEAAGEPATDDRLEVLAEEIRRRRPRPRWVARVHDRWAHGTDSMAGTRSRLGLLAVAALTLLALAAVAGQFASGGLPDRNALGPVIPSPAVSVTSRPSVEIGALCRSDAVAKPPRGPLPETGRPADLPANDGRLAVSSGTLVDLSTGQKDVLAITSEGDHVEGNTWTLPGWSPDGRWLALRRDRGGQACSGELIVSADGTRAIEVIGSSTASGVLDGAWSPDGRWLAVNAGDRIDAVEIRPDGSVASARTVWQTPGRGITAVGPAWGPDGTLAFHLNGLGATVALLSPGASEPQQVQVNALTLAPLAWTTDGSAIVARGDTGADVGMFRITSEGADRIPLDGVYLHGGKWLDVPEAIVGDRIVFAAYTDTATPDVVSVYSVRPDGSGLTRLTQGEVPVDIGVTFAPAPDGHRVAMSANGLWVVDLADGSRRQASAFDGGIMDWQPVP